MFEYHSLISQALLFFGSCFLLFKLNRGFVKYQLRRTMWTFLILIYVFMLSTVQIFNLYTGLIWVLTPLLCVRFNILITKSIHDSRSQKPMSIHKYLPKFDKTSAFIAFIVTGFFAFIIVDYLSEF